MTLHLLSTAIKRHLKETKALLEQVREVNLSTHSGTDGRTILQIWLHMLRSYEFYLRGLVTNVWEPLPYSEEQYSVASELIGLFDQVNKTCLEYLDHLTEEDLSRRAELIHGSASKEELLLEMLEHAVQHRGQILVLYRISGVIPAKIEYLV